MNILKRWWGRAGAGLVVLLLAIQLVPYGRDHRNPPVLSEPMWDSPATRALAERACFDCHSNETRWPAYASIAPASWLVQRDVNDGRAVLNFSEWHRSQEESRDASEEVREGEMPPLLYQLMHTEARLGDAGRARLAVGLEKTLSVFSARAKDEREEHGDGR